MRFPLRTSGSDTPAAPSLDPIPFPPHPAPEPPADLARSGLHFPGPLKGQASGADARAERLVRQVRKDVERLQATLQQLGAAQSDLLEVDAATVAANPQAAATLHPAILVRALVAAHDEHRRLEKQLKKARRQRDRARASLRQARIAAAARDARLATLEDVIAALHANLQDFRAVRDLLPAREAPALSRPAELPGAGDAP
ncbi:hypothetical protein [Tepidiforma sp.]|uniref:hypothetical protein n=1 Tax=Tepidiforma sp. TaxID=2682230 RepID=UPI002ADDAABA|nr:hypothetical protein [Tepidiforma sp.]